MSAFAGRDQVFQSTERLRFLALVVAFSLQLLHGLWMFVRARRARSGTGDPDGRSGAGDPVQAKGG